MSASNPLSIRPRSSTPSSSVATTVAERLEGPADAVVEEGVQSTPVQLSSAPAVRSLESIADHEADEDDAEYADNVDLLFASL